MIKENKSLKDQGVLTSRDSSFSEHMVDSVEKVQNKKSLCCKLDYCCPIRNPEKEDLDKNLYSLERRRRVRFFIINAWEQIEDKK